jgi:hypothetical protein
MNKKEFKGKDACLKSGVNYKNIIPKYGIICLKLIHYRSYIRSSVTWLCIKLNLIIPFRNNLVIIHINVQRGISPFILPFVYPTSM